ncbi:MAG TPA: AraC family transcriptional regulator [Pyrinomonadaceae bacterium]|jgi:AraC-like DNA-binding protein|nr:AraC family transcriptional regulator [Pyrinomonadaceae bacterium]
MNRISVNDAPKIFSEAICQMHDVRPTTIAAHHEAVERVIRMMHDRLDEPLTLQEMSRIAYISPYHFNRIFRQITGIPPNQFFYALRLETAKRLLLTTNTSVTDVCFDVGYNSLGTFIRRFTGLVGLSPGRFRSLARYPTDSLSVPTSSQLNRPAASSLAGISGKVTAPEWFTGTIFVGLFTTPIPQGDPISGTVMQQPGPYHVASVPDGVYFILAAGLARSKDFREYFLHETTLRAGGQPILIRNGIVEGSTDLSLRPPEAFDPPILMTLPLLLAGSATGGLAMAAHRST